MTDFDPVSFSGGFGAGQQQARDEGNAALAHERAQSEIDRSKSNVLQSGVSAAAIGLGMVAIKKVAELREENQTLADANQNLTTKISALETEISKRWIAYGVHLQTSLIARKAEVDVLIGKLKALDPEHIEAARNEAEATRNNTYKTYSTNDTKISEVNKLVTLESELAFREATLGADHNDVGKTIVSLALVHYTNKDFDAAEPLFRRSISIIEKNHGVDNLDLTNLIIILAGILDKKKDYVASEPLYRRVIAIREKQLGSDHLDVAKALINLASMMSHEKNDYAAAEPLYRQILSIKEKAHGIEHAEAIEAKRLVARNLREQGRYDAARELFETVIEVSRRTLGMGHEDTLLAQSGLGTLYKKSGNLAAAREVLSDALSKAKASLGEDHARTKDLANDLNEVTLALN